MSLLTVKALKGIYSGWLHAVLSTNRPREEESDFFLWSSCLAMMPSSVAAIWTHEGNQLQEKGTTWRSKWIFLYIPYLWCPINENNSLYCFGILESGLLSLTRNKGFLTDQDQMFHNHLKPLEIIKLSNCTDNETECSECWWCLCTDTVF